MTIILKKRKLDIKRLVISKINQLIYFYKKKFDIESIYFNKPIDGIIFYKLFPHYSRSKNVADWSVVDGITLLKVLDCLRKKEFYGFCRTTNNKLVKITPKRSCS